MTRKEYRKHLSSQPQKLLEARQEADERIWLLQWPTGIGLVGSNLGAPRNRLIGLWRCSMIVCQGRVYLHTHTHTLSLSLSLTKTNKTNKPTNTHTHTCVYIYTHTYILELRYKCMEGQDSDATRRPAMRDPTWRLFWDC